MGACRRFALLAAVVAGCGGPGEAPPGGPTGGSGGGGATVTFVLAAGADLGKLPAGTADATLDSVAFWIDRLSLSGDRSGGDYDGRLEGRALDLGNGPVSFELNAAPALYSRIRVDLADNSEEHGSSDSMSASFRIAGKTAAGTPFVLRGKDDVQLELRTVDGVELGAHTRLACVIRLDVRGWFADVPLQDAPPGSDPPEEVLQKFQDNLVRSASLTVNAVPRE
jgi:hypothetical protein